MLALEKREKEFLYVQIDTHIFEEIWLEWNADGYCTLEKEEGGPQGQCLSHQPAQIVSLESNMGKLICPDSVLSVATYQHLAGHAQ